MLTSTCRVITASALPSSSLTDDPLEPASVVSGAPQVRILPICEDEAITVGIWEHTVGVSTDVEADEVFVVLSGRASILVAGGPQLEVAAGDVCVLAAGSETEWTIHETLRKIYVVRSA